jgi:hypothetical protein
MMNKLSDNESCSVVEFEPDTTSEQTQSDCDDTIENSNKIITDEIVPDNDTTNTTENNNFGQLENEMKEKYGHQSGQYDLCPRKPCDYSYSHATIDHIALTQYNL